MQHVAIMEKRLGFLTKIVNGQKTIESRWYSGKRAPWGRVSRSDIIYFKNGGEPVSAMGEVDWVIQFKHLTPEKVQELIDTYGNEMGIDMEQENKDGKFYKRYRDKKYCILIFLTNVKMVRPPFAISKKGFGAMSAWITCDSIDEITVEIPPRRARGAEDLILE